MGRGLPMGRARLTLAYLLIFSSLTFFINELKGGKLGGQKVENYQHGENYGDKLGTNWGKVEKWRTWWIEWGKVENYGDRLGKSGKVENPVENSVDKMWKSGKVENHVEKWKTSRAHARANTPSPPNPQILTRARARIRPLFLIHKIFTKNFHKNVKTYGLFF